MASSYRHQLLQRQHQVYFPILNDPSQLVGHVLDFFGPEGPEPLLTAQGRQAAHTLIMDRCLKWAGFCQARELAPLFHPEPPQYDSMAEEELAEVVNAILAILEDGDSLLAQLAEAFGPAAPPLLAIHDENHWRLLDDLFQGRLLPRAAPCSAPGLESPPAVVSAPPSPSLLASSTRPIAPEVLIPEVMPAETPADSEPSAVVPLAVAVGLCAAGVAVGVGGGLVLLGLARALATPTGARAVGAFLPMAVGGMGRRVFTGPRGGRYLITSTGTKSYCVP